VRQNADYGACRKPLDVNGERILYVEDDALLRNTFVHTLLAHGLDVDVASSRSEALSFVERTSYPVIVTDLLVGDADGVSLAHELHNAQPHASFIITTGLDVELRASGNLDESIACFLKKPWSDQQLTSAVDRARASYRVRSSTAPPDEQRYSLLLIEDNAADAYFTALLLERGQLCSELAQCTRMEQALTLLRSRRFDAVIADIGLPDAGELSTVEQLRAAAPDSALIVFSGYDQEAANVQTLRLGAEDYLVKGQTDVELMRRSVRGAVERKRQERRISYMADHDPLTHLINHAGFCQKLQDAMAHTRRSGRHCAVMSLDLDGFKSVNDAHGQEAGDTVLCEIARRIQASVREQDTVARLGADEFGIVLEDLDDPKACGYVARRLLQITSLPILLRDEVVVTVQLSIGSALCLDEPLSAAALLAAANSALSIAKTHSAGQHYHLHSADDAEAKPGPRKAG